VDKSEITPMVVKRLVTAQFPQWADLAVTPVELDGWDNTTFRLGGYPTCRSAPGGPLSLICGAATGR
jgi:aminoglycoside phosphotransferase (APT) family kinase protein